MIVANAVARRQLSMGRARRKRCDSTAWSARGAHGADTSDKGIMDHAKARTRHLTDRAGSHRWALAASAARLVVKDLTLKPTNRGTTALTLPDVQSSDRHFLAKMRFLTIEPGQTGAVTVTFTPVVSETVRSVLTLSFNAPDVMTVVVGMVGAGN